MLKFLTLATLLTLSAAGNAYTTYKSHQALDDCAKANNVYKCEWQALPSGTKLDPIGALLTPPTLEQ